MGWLGLVVLIACFGLAGNARADISVGNAAFDDVYVASGEYTYTITPWNSANEGGGPTPWITNGYYSGEPLPVTPAMITTCDRVYQDLTDTDPCSTYVAGNTYVFSMDIGGWAGYDNIWELFFYDATAGNPATPLQLETDSLPAGTEDNYQTISVEYTATADEDGHAIGIGFRGVYYYVYFDNATVELAAYASNPSPSSGVNGVQLDVILEWNAPSAYTPIGYNVYVDPNQQRVIDATTSTPLRPEDGGITYKSVDQSGATFDPEPDLAVDTVYYWRVDAIMPGDVDPNIVTGSIWHFSTGAIVSIIDKCSVKADKLRDQPVDTIQVAGSSFLADDTDFDASNTVLIGVYNQDDLENPVSLGQVQVNAGSFSNGIFHYNSKEGIIRKLKFDLNKDTFAATLVDDLTGLVSPLVVTIDVGDYAGVGQADETVINGPRKYIPITLLNNFADALRVDQAILNLGADPNTNTDSLTLKGALAVLDFDVDLATEDVIISWGAYSVTLPADDMYRIGEKRAFKYKKPEGSDSSVGVAIFDLAKGTFKIIIKKANIGDQGNPVDLRIQFGDFDETVSVTYM